MDTSPDTLVADVVCPEVTVILEMLYGSAAMVMLLAGQVDSLPDLTLAAVTDVKFAVNGLVFLSLNDTVPLRPGKRSLAAAAELTVTSTAVPVEALPVPLPEDRKYAKAVPPETTRATTTDATAT
jgi:hypothetical protein